MSEKRKGMWTDRSKSNRHSLGELHSLQVARVRAQPNLHSVQSFDWMEGESRAYFLQSDRRQQARFQVSLYKGNQIYTKFKHLLITR